MEINSETLSKSKKKKYRGVKTAISMIVIILLETVLLLLIAAFGLVYVLECGPSPTIRNLFVRSVKETSAVGFLAEIFLSEQQVDEIMGIGNVPEYEDTDTSLIEIPQNTQPSDTDQPVADAWGLVDEDGDGIIVDVFSRNGYTGYMMVVLDPSRVVLASVPENFGIRGYTVAQMVEEFDAVAGVNAGGFEDPNGYGDGSTPNSMVISNGKIYYGDRGCKSGFAGLDSNHILHVGRYTPGEARAKGIQSGVGFGPVLISNSVPCQEDNLKSGLNPRTGIGQRSDGAILLLVIDGRQISSMGATYYNMMEEFLAYGAVNACNMDGGGSSVMWYQGDYINHCASVLGIRPIPTAFLVLKQGVDSNG